MTIVTSDIHQLEQEDRLPKSARIQDSNGWFEVKDNPLSRVGVFPYSGRQIGAPDPDKIYMVFRPEEELSDPECLESFKLLPWIDDHEMLGSESDGLTPAESKGIHGVIGEAVKFAGGILSANIKVFSDSMAKLIESGKRELSCGYRCRYEPATGVFQGQPFDYIQREIRGNHLALVDEGRMGKQVAVLDRFAFDSLTFTLDAKEALNMENEEKTPVTLESLAAMVAAMAEQLAKVTAFMEALKPKEEEEHGSLDEDKPAEVDATSATDEDKPAEGADKCGSMDSAKEVAALKKQLAALETKLATGMDSGAVMRDIADRNDIAEKLSVLVGTFDHATMTKADVEAYGVKKLGLQCAKGQEGATLAGYLAAASKVTGTGFSLAADSATEKSSQVDGYLTGKGE